jgi:hypothetical protein
LGVDSNALRCATPDHPPEHILVVAFAHNFKVVAFRRGARSQRPAGLDERQRRCHPATVGGPSAIEDRSGKPM